MCGGGGGCDSRQRQVAVADGADLVFTDTPSDPMLRNTAPAAPSPNTGPGYW